MLWLLVILVLFLLSLSAIFSGAETALTSVSRARIHRLSKKGSKRATLVKQLQHSMEQLMGTILLGNNFVNILATSLTTSILVSLFGESGVGIATILMTLVILLFAEVMPKVYALQHADRVSLNLAPFIYFVSKLLAPITRLIRLFVRVTWRITGVDVAHTKGIKSAKEEILTLVEMYSDQQMQTEKNMLRGILDLSTVPVSDVMVHRKDMMVIEGTSPLQDVLPEILGAPYTRFPVWETSTDNIIGILHVRSFLKNLVEVSDLTCPVKKFLPEGAWFIPESTSLLRQLQEFRRRRAHMALVVDEYGALQGMVTLEDILEEIVGEITDEYDAIENTIHLQKNGGYLISGLATIRDLNKLFDWQLPDQDAATIGGLLLYETRGLPNVGEVYHFYGLHFKITERHRNQIVWVEIMPQNKST